MRAKWTCTLILIASIALSATCEAKDRDDVTWLFPVVTKGRVYWLRPASIVIEGVPRFPDAHGIYVASDGTEIDLTEATGFSKVVSIELAERKLDEAEFAKLVLKFYHFACLRSRGQFFDQDYVTELQAAGGKQASAIAALQSTCAMPQCKLAQDHWEAVFYVIREDYQASIVERHSISGGFSPFFISDTRTHFTKTSIGTEVHLK